ncbi:MAG: helix-turn-helix transcriptional regulator [Pseudomonadota bacterium]
MQSFDIEDKKLFGQLVRNRRQALGLSQEALAIEALGNPDRKSFISAVENDRLAKVTPNTAAKLCGPLNLAREEIPASLRWPLRDSAGPVGGQTDDADATHRPETSTASEQKIARYLNAQLAATLNQNLRAYYFERLHHGLDLLKTWTGRPLGLQSLLFCFAVSMLYVVITGLCSFFFGEVAVGEVRIFRGHEWTGDTFRTVLPYLSITFLASGLYMCWQLTRPFGRRPLSTREATLRLGGIACCAGVACGVADYVGTATLTAAAVFAVPSVAAIATFRPSVAALTGALGGILFGFVASVSSALTDETTFAFILSLIEGFVIGAVVGLSAGLTASLTLRKIPHFRAGQLAGVGGGLGLGALLSLVAVVIASLYGAMSGGTLGLFAVSWIALPIANAFNDYVSLGISHRLGQHVATSRARPLSVLFIFILDVICAFGLMIGTAIVVGLALHGVSWTLGVDTQAQAFLKAGADDPWAAGLWLTLMVISTTIWTWLHFALVVAPLAAGRLVQSLIERPAINRLQQAQKQNIYDTSVGVLVSFRFGLFYVIWTCIAILPIWLVLRSEGLLDFILWCAWRITRFII